MILPNEQVRPFYTEFLIHQPLRTARGFLPSEQVPPVRTAATRISTRENQGHKRLFLRENPNRSKWEIIWLLEDQILLKVSLSAGQFEYFLADVFT